MGLSRLWFFHGLGSLFRVLVSEFEGFKGLGGFGVEGSGSCGPRPAENTQHNNTSAMVPSQSLPWTVPEPNGFLSAEILRRYC